MKFLPYLCLSLGSLVSAAVAETLPPLSGEKVPQNLPELWGNYDPRSEPLESEICTQWEQDSIICRVIRYRIGIFKGQVATMAAFYAFPKDARKLPTILHLHGGGQSASLSAVTTYAKIGYASLSLNWGGNKMMLADGTVYTGPNTDWGALDATHPPQRNPKNHFAGGTTPDDFTLDPVDSPRNDNWFLVTLGARRALTFLEQQSEVDPGKLGVTGHSMGGRLTVQLAGIDARVKTAVPSCGGSGDFTGNPALFPGGTVTQRSPRDLATRSENPYIERLRVPVLWLSPTNDFHAHIDHFAYTWRNVPDTLLGLSISPHFNHRHDDPHSLSATLWFEQHLKGVYQFPRPPKLEFARSAPNGSAVFHVLPDETLPLKEVRVYASSDPHALTRFWQTITVQNSGNQWTAEVPVLAAGTPLFAYADVLYHAPEAYQKIPTPPGVGASDSFGFSSRVVALTKDQVESAGVRPTLKRERSIDPGSFGWRDWFHLNWGNPHHWTVTTRKIKDPIWRGPHGARLAFEIHPSNDCLLHVTVTRNAWGAFGSGSGTYSAAVPLRANGSWVAVDLGLEDFQPVDPPNAPPLKDWATLTDLSLSGHPAAAKGASQTPATGVGWKNAKEIQIRELRWVGGTYQENGTGPTDLPEGERTKAFNSAIKSSLEQEAKDRTDRARK